MKFTKMHGIGNDYIYVNCFEETVPHPQDTAKFVSDRHFGIGSDGLILIKPSNKADFEMAMYNADGSRGEMCGNAIRCVAKYVYDHHMIDCTDMCIETLAGIKYAQLVPCVSSDNKVSVDKVVIDKVSIDKVSIDKVYIDKVSMVRVNMGKPELEPEKIPVMYTQSKDLSRIINCPITVGGIEYRMTCVSMGNPHCVVFTDHTDTLVLEKIGPLFEHHPYFPNRVNTEFVKVIDQNTVEMRVWERGSGETLACGTGACAVTVACILNELTQRAVTVKLRGGDLKIEWEKDTDLIYMTGPAEHVFEGDIMLPDVLQ